MQSSDPFCILYWIVCDSIPICRCIVKDYVTSLNSEQLRVTLKGVIDMETWNF